MAVARPRYTRNVPPPRRPRVPWRAARAAGTAGSTVAAQISPWNSAFRVYVAWDGVNVANPTWIEVTTFVDIDAGFTVTRGRPDAESQPQVGTCTLTVDNTDGRWSPANPNGAWFGQIRKGCWLRVDVLPPSGVVSTRFIGFIQQLPVSWSGTYSTVQISASDRFVLLGNAPKYAGGIASQWLSDPLGGPYIVGYWPLHEASGSTAVADVSGQAPLGRSTLTVVNQGVSSTTATGSGVAFSNITAPGSDGSSTVNFSPSGTAIPIAAGGGSTGALPIGSYLSGSVGPIATPTAMVTCFVKTTVAYQPVFSWSSSTLGYAIGLGLDPNGLVEIWQGPTTQTSTTVAGIGAVAYPQHPINDGNWHEIGLIVQPNVGTGNVSTGVVVDGSIVYFQPVTDPGMNTAFSPQASVSQLIVGGAVGWWFGAYTGAALFTGAISDVVVHMLPTAQFSPAGLATASFIDFYGPWQAATTMWQAPNTGYALPESCGRRLVRLAQYTGVPVPETTFTVYNAAPFYTLTAQEPTPGVNAFVNIPTETAHPAGYQQIGAQQPVTCMQAASATENMPAFADKLNRITLQPSTLRQNPPVAFTIDARDLDPPTQWADDFQYLQNQTIVSTAAGGSLTVDNGGTASQALYGIYSGSVTAATINNLESTSLGTAVNGAGSNPAPRLNPLQCEVATLATQSGYGAAWYDAVLAGEISSVIQVTNWPSQTPGGSSGTYYVEGYTETWSQGQHVFAWNTSTTQSQTYQCDSATLGVIDTPGITLAY